MVFYELSFVFEEEKGELYAECYGEAWHSDGTACGRECLQKGGPGVAQKVKT